MRGGARQKRKREDRNAPDYPGFDITGTGAGERARAVAHELGVDVTPPQGKPPFKPDQVVFRMKQSHDLEAIRKAAAQAAAKNPTLFGSPEADPNYLGFDHLGAGALARAQEVAKKLGYCDDYFEDLNVNKLLEKLKGEDLCMNQIVAARRHHC